jgi:hypothetical protein
MRVACAVAVTVCALAMTALFLLVLVTKLTVLDGDPVARRALGTLFVGSLVLTAGARAAWRTSPG